METVVSETLGHLEKKGKMTVAILEMLLGVVNIEQLERHMPEDIRKYLKSEEFKQTTLEHFQMVDKDASGYLDLQELVSQSSSQKIALM